MYRYARHLLVLLLGLFCIAYPIAVIGVAFNVRPAFSLSWAGSALLILEGTLLILAAMLVYDWWRALRAALAIIALSTLVEDVGVSTGFPFGVYRYTSILQPHITAQVPLAVPFAWVLVVLGVYGLLRRREFGSGIGFKGALPGAVLALLLDLAIEPVAAYVEHYWLWQPGATLNYYGVPLANFASWLVVAFLLLLLVDWFFVNPLPLITRPGGKFIGRLSRNVPEWLFGSSLLMFGLVDLTHGYYAGSAFALIAGCLIWWLHSKKRLERQSRESML